MMQAGGGGGQSCDMWSVGSVFFSGGRGASQQFFSLIGRAICCSWDGLQGENSSLERE